MKITRTSVISSINDFKYSSNNKEDKENTKKQKNKDFDKIFNYELNKVSDEDFHT